VAVSRGSEIAQQPLGKLVGGQQRRPETWFIDGAIEKRQDAVCKEHDFVATSHSHQIWGLCGACRKVALKAPGRATVTAA